MGFSGDHSRTIELVMSGAYQTGAVNYSVWDAAVAAGSVDTDTVSVIWETPTYPDYQWSIRGDVDARFGKGFSKAVRTFSLKPLPALARDLARRYALPCST